MFEESTQQSKPCLTQPGACQRSTERIDYDIASHSACVRSDSILGGVTRLLNLARLCYRVMSCPKECTGYVILGYG